VRFASGGANPYHLRGAGCRRSHATQASGPRPVSWRRQAQWPQHGYSVSCIDKPIQGVLSFRHHAALLLWCCWLSYQVGRTCLLVARCMRSIGLSHRLFPAITWSPLCLPLACLSGPPAADPGRSLHTGGYPYPLPVTVGIPLAAPRDGLHRHSVSGCQVQGGPGAGTSSSTAGALARGWTRWITGLWRMLMWPTLVSCSSPYDTCIRVYESRFAYASQVDGYNPGFSAID
jgi:hypothetical protein